MPAGLQDAGYRGRVEVFTWQGISHARDQMSLERNRRIAPELTERIRQFAWQHPDRPINLIALSAGTGIVTFALEYLPEKYQVEEVVFLASSLSSEYDMTRALKRIGGGLHVFYSPHDRILRDFVKYSGTVDRAGLGDGVAGLSGFRRPEDAGPDARAEYAKIHNIGWRPDFALVGYEGRHMDATSRGFIREYVGEIVQGRTGSSVNRLASPGRPSSRPSRSSDRPRYKRSASTAGADSQSVKRASRRSRH